LKEGANGSLIFTNTGGNYMASRSKEMITSQELEQLKSYAWTQKYRPTNLDEIILPKAILNPIKKMVREDKKIPHLLFTSVLPGSGKSTLAKVIINELGADFLKINASKDNGIDVIRSQVDPFATRYSLYEDAPKIIWLDEVDGTTKNFQDAFRVPMEEFDQTVSFIMTANYKEQISEAVQDRAEIFDFNMNNAKVKDEILVKIIKRVMDILQKENVTYDETVLLKYCNKMYPRFRNILSGIQKYVSGNGNILDAGILATTNTDEEFFELIMNKKYTPARSYAIKSNMNYDTIYSDLYKKLLPKFTDDKNKYANLLITINQYAVNNTRVVDKELNFSACLVELISII
jgi:DNA polymerase III delta prime subunit